MMTGSCYLYKVAHKKIAIVKHFLVKIMLEQIDAPAYLYTNASHLIDSCN